jgi:AraC family transcriptional regulator
VARTACCAILGTISSLRSLIVELPIIPIRATLARRGEDPMSNASRPERKALEVVHMQAAADVRLLSPANDWDAVAVSRLRLGKLDFPLPPLHGPVFAVNYGTPYHLQGMLQGRTASVRHGPGHISIPPPDFATRWVCDRAGDIVVVSLSRDVLNRSVAEGAARDPSLVEIIPTFIVRDLVLERIAHQLLQDFAYPERGGRLCVETRAMELAARLLSAHSSLGQPLDRRRRIIQPTKLRRVRDLVESGLASDLALSELAAAADMTLFHFAKAFRDTTGLAPHQYVTQRRLLEARTLLHDDSLSIGAIAAAVGFTHSSFTRLFTRHMGMTPTTFRKLLQC